MKKATIILMAIATLVLTGCLESGGGSGSSTPATFELYADGFWQDGYYDTATYSGYDNYGERWSIYIDTQTIHKTFDDGTPYIGIYSRLDMAAYGDSSVTESGVAYDMNHRPMFAHDFTDDVALFPLTDSTVPKTAKIGDIGEGPGWDYENGDYETHKWRLVDAGNGNANFIHTTTLYDNYGNLVGSQIVTDTIREDGTVLSSKIALKYPNGHEINVTKK